MEEIVVFIKSDTAKYIAGAAYVLLEYFLGKTPLVKAGSFLELVLNGFKKVLKKDEPSES